MKRRNLLIRNGRGVLAFAVLAAVWVGVTADPAHAAYTAKVKAGTLRLDGNAASDQLALRLKAGSPGTLLVDVGDDGSAEFSFNRNRFTGIDVDAGRGDDGVRIDQSNGGFLDEAVTIKGGDGSDVLLGGAGEDAFVGGDGNDLVDGGTGRDRALLGDGNDTFAWQPGDGSDTVDGQLGDDRLDSVGGNIGEAIDVSATDGRVRFARDIANVVIDLDNVEVIGFGASGGADTVTVHDLTGTDANTVDLDLAAYGGGGDGAVDTVRVEGTPGPDNASLGGAGGRPVFGGLAAQTRVAGSEAQDVLSLATLGGADTIDAATGIPGPAAIDIVGGDDSDTFRFNGTANADTVDVFANGLEVSTVEATTTRLDTSGIESLVLLGYEGADRFSAVGNVAPLTMLAMIGGDGNDVLRGGNGPDLLLGGNDDDDVDGQQGNDQVQLGAGNDRFQWDPGDGSDTVDGQDGADGLDMFGSNATESIGVSPNGGRTLVTRDIGAITTDVDNVEAFGYHAFGGADSVVVGDLSGTETTTVDIDLAAGVGGGDAQIDTVVALGSEGADDATVGTSAGRPVLGLAAETRIANAEAQDVLRLAAGNGDDTVGVTPGIPGPATIDVDAGGGTDTIRFDGTEAEDTIGVAANGTEVSITEPSTTLVDGSFVESLVVAGHGGSDQISAVGNLAPLTRLTFDGGEGADDLRGGNGADLLLGGSGNDVVDGNQGSDQVQLGNGDDRFRWDPGDGSDLVDGQADSDLLDFFGSNASESIALAADGAGARLTRDIAGISMGLVALEQVAVHAFGGTDTVTVGDLSGTPVDAVDVGLGLFDGTVDGQLDTVVARGTAAADVVTVTRPGAEVVADGLSALLRIAGSEPANDTLRVETLAGDDDVTIAPGVQDAITTVVDLGPDD